MHIQAITQRGAAPTAAPSGLCALALCLALASWSSGCGNVEFVAPDGDNADITGGADTTAGDTLAIDTAKGDASGDECITDYDCKDIKGKTPCNQPTCTNGFCGLKNRDAGASCKDPSMSLTSCQASVCDQAGACVAKAAEAGTACVTTKPVSACEQAVCDADATCVVEAKADGAHCGLGICGNKCHEGACVLATAADYDDGDPCTKDYCDQGAAIVHDPITDLTLPCDDGDACTKNDFCLEGKCSGTIDSCNDGKPCTIDLCEKEKGCTYKADDKACSGDDPCVQLACDLAVGCTATGANPGVDCDDGDKCTTGDVCGADGACKGPTNSCTCQSAADCDQTDLCLPRLCDAQTSTCVVDQSKAIVCDGSADGFCGKNTCEPATGLCAIVAKNEGKDCDDNDVCTSASKCSAGSCDGAVDKGCDDANPCTSDACDPLVGCVHTPGGSTCDDNNPCTDNDLCQSGGCVGTGKSCDDGVTCTLDSCDPSTGKCVNDAKDVGCDDANPCTSDACDATGAKGCKSVPNDSGECDDGDECTNNGCKGGQCVVTSVNKELAGCGCQKDAECNDNNPCTADSCKSGDCVFDGGPTKGQACATNNACHVANSGTCEGGVCTGGKSKDCSGEADGCHDAACNPKTGACEKSTKADGTACDADGDACTAGDACKGGSCAAGPAVVCPEGDDCNLSVCDTKTGKCALEPQAKGTACEDGVYCTAGDSCDGAGKCSAGGPRDCTGQGDACNDGVCDEDASQCGKKPKAKGTACNDGQFCTEADACDGSGQCAGGKDKVCGNGNNACLVGVCDEGKDACGTKPVPKDTACSDGDACTLKDGCDGAGTCVGSNPKTCAGDACNDGVCAPTTGNCSTKPKAKGSSCNDGDLCTQTDTCDGAGKCTGANPVTCKGDACNDGVCKGGSCGLEPKTNGVACDDGNACTSKDFCSGGVCKPGTYTCNCKVDADCNDNNTCTSDTCASSGGTLSCVNKVLAGLACSDGNACTTKDACDTNGVCVGTTVNCDDGNDCTADSCSAKLGTCSHVAQKPGFPCTDNNACTTPDACDGSGKCTTKSVNCDDGEQCTIDSCDAKSGKCLHSNKVGSCDDGNACTSKEACNSGKCTGGLLKLCNDGTKCTNDSCNTKTGACTATPTNENLSCEAGSFSVCLSGSCDCRFYIKTSGGSSTDRLYDNVFSTDYTTVSVGQTYNGKTGYDGYLVVRDKGGNVKLNKSVYYAANASSDALHGVAAGASGKFVAVGTTVVTNAGNEGWVVEFNQSGSVYRNFAVKGGEKNDVLHEVVKLNDSTYYAAGYSYSFNNPGSSSYSSGWLVKLNLSKSPYVEWQKTRVGIKVTQTFPSIKFSYDHYVFYGLAYAPNALWAAGYTTGGAHGGNDGVIVEYDLNGKALGEKTYGTSGSDYFRSVKAYGSYVWAAGTVTNGSNGSDGWIVKVNKGGLTQLYDKRHGSTGYDEFRDITNYGSGLLAVGRKYDTKALRYRPWMVRTSSTGNISAQYEYDTNQQNRYLYGVSYNGYVAMCGETYTGSNYDAYSLVTSYAGKSTCP